jgi:uncharacterized membrane protein
LIAALILVTAISPVLWNSDLTKYIHVVFANYFNRLNGSLFPVFPWLNFLLAGAVFANYFIQARKQNREVIFVKYSALTGIILLAFGHLFYSGMFPGSLTSLIPNPVFYLERLGYVLLFLALCWLADRKTKIKNSFVIDASRESLLIYWLHLVVIYGMIWGGKSLASRIGSVFNIIEAVIATLILMLIMILVAKIWGWLKSKYSRQSSLILRVAIVILLILFVTS